MAGIANLFDKVLNKRGQPRLNRMLMPGALEEEEPKGGRSAEGLIDLKGQLRGQLIQIVLPKTTAWKSGNAVVHKIDYF